MLMPIEAMSAEAMIAEGVVPEVAMAVEGAAPKFASMEVPVEVLKSLRTSRPRPMPT